MKEKIYTPDSEILNPIKLIKSMFIDLWLSKELGWRLAVRDISAQYRQSLLGVIWALLVPLANTAAWLFLSKAKVINVSQTDIPYPVFVFTGSLIWSILIEALNAPLQQVEKNKEMLSKANFPRESIILSGIFQTLFNSLIKVGILIIVLPFFEIKASLNGLFIPFGILTMIMMGTTYGLLLTPVGVLYSDISRGIPLLTQFLMYLSPVVYPIADKGLANIVMRYNPFSSILINTRAWFTGQPSEYLFEMFLAILVTFCILIFVWIFFRLSIPIVIERISS